MWAIGGGADARVPGPQTPLGLWLREVWEPPHTTAGWAVGGVKVRPESKWATVKNAPQPTNSRPQRAGRSAGWGELRRLCPGYQAESARLKMVGPVTAVLRHLRKAAEHGHPKGARPSQGSAATAKPREPASLCSHTTLSAKQAGGPQLSARCWKPRPVTVPPAKSE